MQRRNLYLLILIIIIASFLRLYKITTIPPGLYPDEAMNGNNAVEALQTGDFKVFYPENNGREGLFINTQALFLKFFGANSPSQISQGETWEGKPWILRLPSAIFGILTVVGIYFLATELFGSNAVGLLSAFLLATSFWHINFSRIGFRAILAPFFLVWALYLLLKAAKGLNLKNCVLFSVAGGALYGLGFYTYISYRITPLLLVLLIPFFRKEKNFWRAVSVFLITTFIVALPIGIYFLKNPADFLGRTSQISIFSSPSPLKSLGLNILKTAGMFNVRGDYNWRHNISGRPELFWPVGILFLIGVFIGAEKLIKGFKGGIITGCAKDFNFSISLSFLLLILAALPVVISNESIPHALRSILMIPPVFILAALGGVWLYEFLMKYNWQFLLKTVAVIFFLLVTLEAYNDYFIVWAQNPNVPGAFNANYVDIGEQINALPNNVPKYVIVEAGGVLVRGIPMPAETVMFITDTFMPQDRQAKNVYYVPPQYEKEIPAGAVRFYIK